LGFQKRQDRIAISQFTDGLKSKEGETLDSGTGLSISTVKKCLANLVTFNLMIRVQENDSKTNEGVLWGLQWDSEKVNWTALEERENKKAKVYRKIMKKARSMRHTPANGIEGGSGNGIERTPANGIETQKPVEIQGNTVGTDVPLPENLPLDWQMAAGAEQVVIPNLDEAKRIDFANLVAMGTSNPSAAREIALIFQNERNITLPTDEKKVKGQRKAIVEMLGYGVTPNHVVQAIRKLLTNRMTFTDLFGVAKTAIDLATQPQNYAGNGSHAL
jgi:hypothetical protein